MNNKRHTRANGALAASKITKALAVLISASLLFTSIGFVGASEGAIDQSPKDQKEPQSKDPKQIEKEKKGTKSSGPIGNSNDAQGTGITPLGETLRTDKGVRRSLDVAARFDERVLDTTLRDLIRSGSPRRHYVYDFRRVGREFQLDFRAWNGLLAVRNLSVSGRPTTFRLLDRRGRAVALGRRRLLSGWYKNADGSISKLLLNGRHQPVGSLTIDRSGNKMLTIDLNGDGRAEFLAVHGSAGRLQIVTDDTDGLRLYRELMEGSASLCDARSSAPAVDPDPRFNFLCQRRSIGGSSSRSLGGVKRSSSDAMEGICAALLTGRPDSPVPTYADESELIGEIILGAVAAASGPAGLFLLIVTWPNKAGETNPPTVQVEDVPDGDGAIILDEVEITAGENTVFIEEAIVVESTSDSSSRTGGSGTGGSSRDRPTPDADKGINALREVCKARRDLAARWRYLTVKEANNCDNPYRVPIPGPADQSFGRLTCTDPDEPFIDPERTLREAGSNNCGPFAQPGPDGRCQGRGMFFNSSRGGRGSYAFAASGVMGVQPCDPRFCNPPPSR